MKTKNRTFSKRITASALASIMLLAFYGVYTGYPDLADLITVVGIVSLSHIGAYMGVGYADFRVHSVIEKLVEFRKGGGNAS